MIAATLIGIACSGTRSAGQSPSSTIGADLKHLESLRKEGQYALAASYCQRKLRAAAADPQSRVRYAVEWIRTLAEQAWDSPPEEGEPFWNDALSVAQRYGTDHPDDPRRVLVQVQQGLVHAARGRWQKRQQEVAARPDFSHALVELRRATRRLQEINEQLVRVTVHAASRGLAPSERVALRNNVRQHLADAHLEMAECFAVDSADRINACSRGLFFLRQIPAQQLSGSRRWAWFLARIRAHVLMHRHQMAEQLVDEMLDQEPPSDERWRAEAERARCRLNEGRPAEGFRALAALPLHQTSTSVLAEVEYVKLCCLMALWDDAIAKDSQTMAATWQQRTAAQLNQIEGLASDYWFRRAELVLTRAVEQGGGGGKSGQILKRTADNYYRRGDLAAAGSAYQQATEHAALEGHEEDALQWTRLAAAVRQQQGNRELAVSQLRAAALRFSRQPQAAETHWLAVLGQAAMLREPIPAPGRRDNALNTYQEMLAEHVDHWPQSPSAIEAHAWSARLARQHQRWEDAIGHGQSVLRHVPDRTDIVIILGKCYRDWLGQLRQSGKGTTSLARRASNQLAQYCDGLSSTTDRSQLRTADLIRAEIEIRYLPESRGLAGERLQRLLDASDATPGGRVGQETDVDWQRAARMLLIERHSLVGDWKAARKTATELKSLPLPDALRLIGLLEGSLQADQAVELGQLQSQVLQQIDTRPPLSAADRDQLFRRQARALVLAGQWMEALAILERLAQQLPSDGEIQEEYAQVLAARGNSAALVQWRQVLRKSPPETARWYRAKYAIAELHYMMGDRARAAQVIRLLKTLHPDLGGAPMKDQFEALLARCES